MPSHHTKPVRKKPNRPRRKPRLRRIAWKEIIAVVSLLWSVFRFWWEYGHGGSR